MGGSNPVRGKWIAALFVAGSLPCGAWSLSTPKHAGIERDLVGQDSAAADDSEQRSLLEVLEVLDVLVVAKDSGERLAGCELGRQPRHALPRTEAKRFALLSLGRGKVLAPDGSVPAEAWIIAWCPDALGFLQVEVQSDGSFAFGPLDPGSVRVRATSRSPSARSPGVQVEAGDLDVELRLELLPSAQLELRCEGLDPACGYEVRSAGITVAAGRLKLGACKVVHVRPGPVEVVFELGGSEVETQRTELGVGEKGALVFAPDR